MDDKKQAASETLGYVPINQYVAILIQEGVSPLLERPTNAKECYVLKWPDADVEIPWPEGMTVKEAIVAWGIALLEIEESRRFSKN